MGAAMCGGIGVGLFASSRRGWQRMVRVSRDRGPPRGKTGDL